MTFKPSIWSWTCVYSSIVQSRENKIVMYITHEARDEWGTSLLNLLRLFERVKCTRFFSLQFSSFSTFSLLFFFIFFFSFHSFIFVSFHSAAAPLALQLYWLTFTCIFHHESATCCAHLHRYYVTYTGRFKNYKTRRQQSIINCLQKLNEMRPSARVLKKNYTWCNKYNGA